MLFFFEAITIGSHIESFVGFKIKIIKKKQRCWVLFLFPLKGQAKIKFNRPQTIYQIFQYAFEVELNHIS